MSEPARSPRRMGAALIAAMTLLGLGIVVGVDHGRLSRLEKSMQASEHASEIARLSSQYAALASDVGSLKAAPLAASEASVNTLNAQWAPRLSALEQGALTYATAHDLVALTDRMDAVETRLARVPRKSTTTVAPTSVSSASSVAIPPARLDPPFLALGIELRGGERFLSIVPAGASSIAKARALRPGDREGSWMLERLERDIAEFRVDGQVQRLSVPR